MRDGESVYCATCGEVLSAAPLDADCIVVLIHALAGHRVEECGFAGPEREGMAAA